MVRVPLVVRYLPIVELTGIPEILKKNEMTSLKTYYTIKNMTY